MERKENWRDKEPAYTPPYYEDDEIDLYELYLTLKKRKKIVLGTTFLFTAIALILCFILPKTYKTNVSIMPLGGEKKSGLSSLLSSLPVSIPGMSQSGLTVESILQSRILREKIVNDLNLLPILFKDKWDNETKKWILNENEKPPTVLDGAEVLKNLISYSSDKKTGVITINVEFKKDPVMAYKIANDLLNATEEILKEKTFTVSKKYRIYLGKQLEQVRKRLEKLQKIYSEFTQGKIREIPMLSFTEDEIEKGKKEGSLIAKREKLKAYLEKPGLTPYEKEKIKRELSQIEKQLSNIKGEDSYVSVPDYQFNLMRLKTEIGITQGLYETLVKEYELAKAQEMKEQISFQVIDPPYIPDPDKPAKPKKKLIVAVGLISGLFLGIFAAFFKEWLDNIKKRDLVEEKQ
ncbi:GumC family protein [Desulfurobacterium atlanticum]|uniref:Uncharacterized protein involved in exopolysaccharide biosynthesis n=1 Tax=Desulfurobacterium atlanticum TaxID=240169 RepID=A0A239AB34_9BACT|nr:Wzz/FepE/Etk N-terminal domain-containing protein [Desulfurobacterium atlanticum]SNR92083.1 Uncharacterized protein involved in exopolysaccharide biosynthesis [Desulfurobacterium atlanticum]